MLTEKEVRLLYEGLQKVVEHAMQHVTIDVHVVEAEQHCRAYAKVLQELYVVPQRK